MIMDSFCCRDRGDIQSEKSFVPCYWKTDALPGISGGDFGQCKLIELEPYSREYFNIFYDVGQSMGCENIFMIVAVQNLRLWMTYTMYAFVYFFTPSLLFQICHYPATPQRRILDHCQTKVSCNRNLYLDLFLLYNSSIHFAFSICRFLGRSSVIYLS